MISHLANSCFNMEKRVRERHCLIFIFSMKGGSTGGFSITKDVHFLSFYFHTIFL